MNSPSNTTQLITNFQPSNTQKCKRLTEHFILDINSEIFYYKSSKRKKGLNYCNYMVFIMVNIHIWTNTDSSNCCQF